MEFQNPRSHSETTILTETHKKPTKMAFDPDLSRYLHHLCKFHHGMISLQKHSFHVDAMSVRRCKVHGDRTHVISGQGSHHRRPGIFPLAGAAGSAGHSPLHRYGLRLSVFW